MLTMIQERWNESQWRAAAMCRDLNPDIFFPVGVTGMAIEQIEAAKEFCKMCPSASDCLEFAVTTNQEYGVWGGTTEDERRVLRRKWRAANRRPPKAQRRSESILVGTPVDMPVSRAS
jgi:WhiB family transcriptional regulator, redox-sensing transcriptional regulator